MRPRIYVKSLLDEEKRAVVYVDQSMENILLDIEKRLDGSEDWMIMDFQYYDKWFDSFEKDLNHISKVGQTIKKEGESFAAFYFLFKSLNIEEFNRLSQGWFKSKPDYIRSYLALKYSFKEKDLEPYFDYETFGKEKVFIKDIKWAECEDGSLYIFREGS